MIKINLLPQEMAGGRPGAPRAGSGGGGSAIVALVLAAIFIVDIGIAAFLFLQYTQAQARFNAQKLTADATKKAMTDKQGEYNNAQMSYDRMNRLIAVAEALDPPDRLLWSRKLNALPLLVPDGIYTTQLQVTQKTTERETQASIKKRNDYDKLTKKTGTTPPVPEKVPVFAQTLLISGIAYVAEGTENQRLDNIVQFKRNLADKKVKLPFDKAETSFLDGFNPTITPSAVATSKVDGRDVETFRFTINAKPLTIEEKVEDQPQVATNSTAAPGGKKP